MEFDALVMLPDIEQCSVVNYTLQLRCCRETARRLLLTWELGACLYSSFSHTGHVHIMTA